ncbi:hypothetical protein L1887_09235 [Cichorium endivia]|nr:hypothetical protein L1887_09235 [Cichorium endivia]
MLSQAIQCNAMLNLKIHGLFCHYCKFVIGDLESIDPLGFLKVDLDHSVPNLFLLITSLSSIIVVLERASRSKAEM